MITETIIVSCSCGGGHRAAASALESKIGGFPKSATVDIIPNLVSIFWNQAKANSFSALLRLFDRSSFYVDALLHPVVQLWFLRYLKCSPEVKDVYIVQPMFLEGLLGAISDYNKSGNGVIKAHIIFTDLFGPDCNYVEKIRVLSEKSKSAISKVWVPYFNVLGERKDLKKNAIERMRLPESKIVLSSSLITGKFSRSIEKRSLFNFRTQGVEYTSKEEFRVNQMQLRPQENLCFVMLGGYPDEQVLLQYIDAIYNRERQEPVCLYVVFNNTIDSVFYEKVRCLVALYDFSGFRLVVTPRQDRDIILSAMRSAKELFIRQAGMSSMEALATHHDDRQLYVHVEDAPSWEEQNFRVLKKCLNANTLTLHPLLI
jgi:hypothetical protein